MDQMIRRMLRYHSPVDLAQSPDWMEMVELYDAMKKMLPPEYIRAMGGVVPNPTRRRKWDGGFARQTAYFDHGGMMPEF